ncbi:DUF1289 domain-containing protein [Pseudoalteromonas luteoviolacea]|uniref:Fe-S oxidoreductase n=1 Tax=Pseudoalteromonas luteoviolacea S4060-1 TaxID=1365257 RepID=A0A167KZ58_9GAMM|nr:DUF1289 domain-containing protein [Pseudoalteromonas luteoviolacea]KZN38863.1 hypothetical protein N480_11570 [Pseudoalteromonas luteoviolacea S2607]KZN63551.1 hypothetical protein N478_23715 [Pseudoalteromonas luteoviolacea S4060-1]
MEQIEIFPIPSPCKGICEVNNRGYCKGCFRSREERFCWNKMTEQQKRTVVELCQRRKKRVLAKQKADAQATSETNTGHQEDLFKSDT